MASVSEAIHGARTPTRFGDLNALLVDLVDGAEKALGKNFLGAYLVGSFALGDGDECSDVDFLVVTRRAITAAEESRVGSVHGELYDSPVIWAQHLEGSYPPCGELRRLQQTRSEWLYIDNGSREMERSTHCNTAVVRSALHEHGVRLAGPDPREIVDPVPAEDLRREAADMAARYRAWVVDDPAALNDAWSQPYAVMTFCRILATYRTGSVLSKSDAIDWAVANVDAQWRSLIEYAKRDRPDTWGRVHRPSRPELVEPTRRFAEHVLAEVRQAGAYP